MKLETGNSLCTIRSWQKGDELSLVQHANNYNIWLQLRDRFPFPYTKADAEEWIKYATTAKPETNFTLEINGKAAGGIGLQLQEDVERISAEVGYWLGQEFWGQGILTAALQAFTPWAMKKFSLCRLYALPFTTNCASARVLEKAGYRLEGILRCSALKNSQVLDQFLFAFTEQAAPLSEKL